jgi:hypothetical protein
MVSTENKSAWVAWGVNLEAPAIERAQAHGLPLVVSPERARSKYAVDAAVLCDIKTRHTPFMRSLELYGIPTRRCVTLNVDDAERYQPMTLILFDVRYADLGVRGQWIAFLDELVARKPAVHTYLRRKDDPINKQTAYVLDLAWMKRIP